MRKKDTVLFPVIVIFFISACLAALFGYNQHNIEKYYEDFKYTTNFNQKKEITFINELTFEETKGVWFLKVYFDQNGKLVKFENYNREGQLYDTTPNMLALS